ncbi:MAG: hypothetical protein IJZ01_01215 [Paraprevotella sp.]|nr:hypothetical protein [Paraprevotella sp.]
MRRKSFYSILLFTFCILFCQCNNTDFDVEKQTIIKWPETSKQLGLAVAKELSSTIKILHKKGTDYSNANDSQEFKELFYNDFFNANPNYINIKNTNSIFNIDSKDFVKQLNNLTKIQRFFLDRIIEECSASVSVNDFYSKILAINNDIYRTVPEIEQERLFNVTSVLFHCMKEIQSLEESGLMIPTPRTKIKHILLKTRSETNNNISEVCIEVLATSMAVALATPIPGDEFIVGGVITAVATGNAIISAGVWLYEYIVCKKSTNSVNCQEYFEKCYSPIQDGCSICLQFCLTQGYWPPYLTHKCEIK